jgi:hypothetical protein
MEPGAKRTAQSGKSLAAKHATSHDGASKAAQRRHDAESGERHIAPSRLSHRFVIDPAAGRGVQALCCGSFQA